MLSVMTALAQNPKTDYQNVIPPTPEVAALAKYVDMPVSYSSGVPQIGVPLYTVSNGSLQAPVSLSYNASGIKVEEAATWVGLGWNLNAGGSITRVVRGMPDDVLLSGGYDYMSPSFSSLATMATYSKADQRDFFDGTFIGSVDLEPDMFSFSAMGYSGKFMFNQDSGKFILFPYQNITIQYAASGTDGIVSFVLTLPNGVKCYFGISDDATRTAREKLVQRKTTQMINGVTNAATTSTQVYYTTWSLMNVVAPDSRRLNFYYTTEEATDFGRNGDSQIFIGGEGNTTETESNYYEETSSKPVLQKMEGELADVYLVPSVASRQDIAEGINALDSVIVKQKNGQVLRSFKFFYHYTTSADSLVLPGLSAFTGVARKRLMLDSLAETGNDNSRIPAYVFSYSSLPLPNRLSSSQDYWGYYNGRANSYLLLPQRYNTAMPGLPEGYVAYGLLADRRIDMAYTQAGMLTAVRYPTGGTTEYYYEPNMADKTNFSLPRSFVPQDVVNQTFTFMPLMYASAPYPRNYSSVNFTVTRPLTKVQITPMLPSPCGTLANAGCLFTINIVAVATSTVLYTTNTTSVFYASLPAGTYRIDAVVAGSTDDPVPPFQVNAQWDEAHDDHTMLMGGLRISKILSKSNAGATLARSYKYEVPDSSGYSSGVVKGFPVTQQPLLQDYCATNVFTGYEAANCPFNTDTLQDHYLSNSVAPLFSEGQSTHYLYVTEFYDTAGTSYKTEYHYFDDWEFKIWFTANQVLVPNISKEWRRVLIGKKLYEKYNSTSYRVLNEESYYYLPFNINNYTGGYRATLVHAYPGITVQNVNTGAFTPYNVATEWFLLNSSTNTQYAYDDAGTATQLTVSTQYAYSQYQNQYQVHTVQTVDSKGQVKQQLTTYPTDYNDVPGFNFSTMISGNMVSLPIKQETTVNGYVTQGTVIKYNTATLPVEAYSYENSLLEAPAAFDPNTVIPAHYNLKASIDYTSGRTIQVTPTNAPVTSFVWIGQTNGNVDQLLPVAQAHNASVTDVAYTSFEDGYALGNWGISGVPVYTGNHTGGVTGKTYFSGSLSIAKSGLTSGTAYLVTYWTKQSTSPFSISGTVSGWPKLLATITNAGGTWYNYEHRVTGQTTITVSGTGDIDELRLYPLNAQLLTNSQEPGVGITSQCDASGRLLYYEYDGLQRLKLVRDQDGHILKQYTYHYNGQPDN